MIGAIIGDIVGSIYEFDNHKSKEFDLFGKESTFTDDTVMTIAVADFLNDGRTSQSRFIEYMHKWYLRYPDMTYGAGFRKWIEQFDTVEYRDWKPIDSYGNGAAMRISPIGDVCTTENCVQGVEFITGTSHAHKEGIKGAESTAMLIMKSCFEKEKDKSKLKKFIEDTYGYDLSRTVDELRETYEYNETCQRTVPEAIICFLESTDFEDAIRNAISIGGDSDTLAAITGSIAEAYYEDIPEWIIKETISRLPYDIKEVIEYFISDKPYYKDISEKVLKFI